MAMELRELYGFLATELLEMQLAHHKANIAEDPKNFSASHPAVPVYSKLLAQLQNDVNSLKECPPAILARLIKVKILNQLPLQPC